MQFFLSGQKQAINPEHPLWNRHLPMARHGKVPDDGQLASNRITYGEYFTAVEAFFRDTPGEAVADRIAESDSLGVYLEKHGAFYHPSRVVVSKENHLAAYVLNVAVSRVGKEHLEREFSTLGMLAQKYAYPFLPRVFACREIAIDESRSVGLFLGEWFESCHEFHFSEKNQAGSSGIRVWDPHDDRCYLSDEQARSVFEQSAMILSACYDIQTFEQVSAWHHAAGDFVVSLTESSEPVVKLVTVRRYAPLLEGAEVSAETLLNGLLLFLLDLSIRMRLDRLDGVGGICWIDSYALEGALSGFFKGLDIQLDDGRLPPGFVDFFQSFLTDMDPEDLQSLFHGVAGRLNPGSPEIPVIQSHLGAHADSFCSIVKTL